MIRSYCPSVRGMIGPRPSNSLLVHGTNTLSPARLYSGKPSKIKIAFFRTLAQRGRRTFLKGSRVRQCEHFFLKIQQRLQRPHFFEVEGITQHASHTKSQRRQGEVVRVFFFVFKSGCRDQIVLKGGRSYPTCLAYKVSKCYYFLLRSNAGFHGPYTIIDLVSSSLTQERECSVR